MHMRYPKKLLAIALVCLVNFSILGYAALPAQAADVTVSAGSIEGTVGDTVQVNIELSAVSNMSGGSLNIIYDPLLAAPLQNGVEAGSLLKSSIFVPNPDYKVGNSKAIRVVWANTTGISGSGVICSLSFKLLAPGRSDLVLNDCILKRMIIEDKIAKSESISCSVTNGSISITGNSGTETGSDPTGGNSGSSNNGGNSGSTDIGNSAPTTPTVPVGAKALKDVEKHWALSYIKPLIESGVITGYPDSTFKPDNSITRAEFAHIISLALKLAPVDADNNFKDWDSTQPWARSGIAAAAKAGIITGYEDGTFRPDQEISRSEMAVMIIRAMHKDLLAGSALTFSDSEKIPAWAQDYVKEAVKLEIIKGKDNNLFKPDDQATRAEACCMLIRLLNKI